MKFSAALVLAAVSAVDAFSPAPLGARRSVSLYSTRPDTSEYIAAALEASKTYGATSKEARLAWATVEEMDSADNSGAYTGGVTDEECLVSEIEACQEYNAKLVELSQLIEENAPKMDSVKSLASEIKAIKIANPEIKAGADSPTLRKALAVAQAATEKHGATSKEAKLAWENVEELAAAGTGNSMGTNLLDECLVEEIEACEGLEELQRVLAKQ
jgi:hypothetical protein